VLFRSKDLLGVATKPGPLLLGLCFGLYALQFMAVYGFLPILLIEELGQTQAAAAVMAAVVVAANIPGNLLGGWLLQRGARRVTVLAGACLAMGLSGLGVYSAALAGSLRYALVILFSALGGMIPAALFNAAPRHAPAPHLAATTTGLMMQGASLGSAVGPPLLAWVVGLAGGWRGGSCLLVTMAALDLLAVLALGRLEKRGR
jgi:cyanate permease